MNYVIRPCAECPWRTDVAPGQFTAARFRALARCAEDMATTIFACHKSPQGGEFICAGFLLQQSAHNLSIRLARRTQPFDDVVSPYPLHPHYRAMAIANGVRADDPCLRHCRDDGQTRLGDV